MRRTPIKARHVTLFAAACMVLGLGVSGVRAEATLSPIGTPGATNFTPTAINNLGQVVGYVRGGTQGAYTYTSALYSGGSISLLPNMAGFTNAQAFDINDSGQIVGTAFDSTTFRGFLYNTGSYTNLGVLPGGTYSTASGINNSGQITGNSAGRGYFYSAGTMTDIGLLFPAAPDSSSSGVAINNAGTIAGSSGSNVGAPGQIYHAVSWSNGTLTGYTDDPRAVSTAINNNGVLVGWGQFATNWAILYDNGQRFDMASALSTAFGVPSDYSKAFGINDLNMVVGQVSVISSTGDTFEGPLAYLYNYNSISVPGTGYLLRDLVTLSDGTTPGFTSLETALDINNLGQIIGMGTYFDGTNSFSAPYMLQVEVVPEPSTLALFLAGGAVAALRFRRRAQVATV